MAVPHLVSRSFSGQSVTPTIVDSNLSGHETFAPHHRVPALHSAFTKPIQACQCREYGTPICAQFWRSDAVFIGQVVDIRPLKKKPDDVYTYVMVRFRVQESFRGVSGSIVGVGTATTMCDTKFKESKRYLVYAFIR
jgi:hypothetical protein